MTSNLTLEALAADINARLIKGDDYLLAAALHLEEAKKRIEAGEAGKGVTFESWCAENIRTKAGSPRSLPEIKRLLGYARSPDPGLALEKVKRRRKQVREAVARHAVKRKFGLANPAAPALRDKSPEEIAEEVARRRENLITNHYQKLIMAWDTAPEEAKQRFLEKIGAELKGPVRMAAASDTLGSTSQQQPEYGWGREVETGLTWDGKETAAASIRRERVVIDRCIAIIETEVRDKDERRNVAEMIVEHFVPGDDDHVCPCCGRDSDA